MTESRTVQRQPQTPSFIPLISPRPVPARSTLPSSLSVPQLSLVPPSRQKTPTNGAHASNSSVSSGGGGHSPGSSSGISSFRSFRNFFPFSNSKAQAVNGATSSSAGSTPKNHVSSFGAVRKTPYNERRSLSTHHVRARETEEEGPVICIEPTRRSEQILRSNFERTASGSSMEKALPLPPALPNRSQTGPPVLESSIIALGTDLSTIMESETSGISKHIPPLDDSQERSRDTISLPKFSNPPDSSIPHGPPSTGPSTDSQDDDALDLSTSDLRDEVLSAMKQEGAGKNWTNGIVVDDVTDSVPASSKASPAGTDEAARSNDLSFDLDNLDPDLAALLSPNRFADAEPALLMALDTFIRPSLTPPLPFPEPQLRPSSSSTPLRASVSSSSGKRSPSLSTRLGGGRSSPGQKRNSVSRTSVSTAPSSSSSLPQPVPPEVGHPAPSDVDIRIGDTVSDEPVTSDIGRRASDSSARRRPPPSPLRTAHPLLQRHNSGDDSYVRNPPPSSRLATPARPSTSLATTNTARPSRHLATGSASAWETESVSPSSRTTSSMGTSGARRLHQPRPSMDNIGRGSLDRDRATHVRSRRRSTSMSGSQFSPAMSPYQTSIARSSTDWLGPRTQKAFAAAGLLNSEGEATKNLYSGGNTPRFGSMRSAMSEKDSRSQYAPSRMGFSETSGSVSSWGRAGSGSRKVTTPDARRTPSMDSPTFSSTTRTFSPSTAATSISAASSVQHHHQADVENLRDKHAMETEALLSALADSQRTTKVLRDENDKLRDRVSELEVRLDDVLSQLRRQQFLPPPPSMSTQNLLSGRNVFERMPRPGSSDGAHKRSQSRTQTISSRDRERPWSPKSSVRPEAEAYGSKIREMPVATNSRRSSGTSSLFHIPPTNMSMLIHEEGAPGDFSSLSSKSMTPPSPTLVLPKVNKFSNGSRHAHNKSVSSGNISPTATSFSTMPGSPGSLNLRPDHETHLEDLASLNLGAGEDEYDYSGDGDG